MSGNVDELIAEDGDFRKRKNAVVVHAQKFLERWVVRIRGGASLPGPSAQPSTPSWVWAPCSRRPGLALARLVRCVKSRKGEREVRGPFA